MSGREGYRMDPLEQKNRELDKKAKTAQQIGIFTGIPMLLLAYVFAGWFMGAWLDKRFHTDKILTAVCILLCVGLAFREIFRLLKKL
jgi:cyanate permease